MALKVDAMGRVTTPASDREALMDLFEQGGMSGAAFARLHGIRYPTFAHWRRMRRLRSRGKVKAEPAVAAFQEVVLEPAQTHCDEAITIELPLGARVRLERVDQVPLIVVLCRHLREGASC
jgi:transposase-like protein